MVEAKTIIPSGLSIKSGRRAPIARYLGSMIVFNRGAKYDIPKNTPSVMPICPKEASKFKDTLIGSVAKNLAILQHQWKTSQIGYLYAINRSIMIQKAIVIA